MKWALLHGGEIINADSMQVYRELDILTACPTNKEMEQVPHHLYRVLKGNDACSAERWRDMARSIISEVWEHEKTPIVVGGTGLYLKALVYGLSPVPKIDENGRMEVRAEVTREGAEMTHAKLTELDPEMAVRLAPGDSQRIARALEVIRSTGRSLALWQQEPKTGGLVDEDVEISKHVLMRDRAELYDRCNYRFQQMIETGAAIDEVRALMALKYPHNIAVMKSLGVAQIINYLDENSTLEEAITLSQTATRQFAKRQMTWFKNQFSNWKSEKL